MLVSTKVHSFLSLVFCFCFVQVAFANEFSLQLASEKDNVLVGESINAHACVSAEYEPCA